MPVSFDLIEKSYAKAVNGSSLNEDSLAAVRQSIDAGRKLLQVDDSSNSSTVSPIDPNATDPFAYMAQNSCENKNWELLNPTFILDSDGQNVAVDDENIPLMKFTLPRGHTARIKLDWRLIDENLKYGEHYELLIFTNPVIDDTTLCRIRLQISTVSTVGHGRRHYLVRYESHSRRGTREEVSSITRITRTTILVHQKP